MTVITATLNPSIDKTFAVDRLIPDRKLAGSDVTCYPGGGGINVARVLTRLGAPVRAYWSFGGEVGHRLAGLIDAEHVPHEPVPIEGEVRENIIVSETSTGNQYRFGLPGPTLSKKDRDGWMEVVKGLSPECSYIVFSGSLTGEMSLDWFEELLRAVPKGPRLIVDTKNEAMHRALRVGVYLIKPNIEELEELTGREMLDDTAVERACREIVEGGGAEVVLMSLGRAGALLVTADRVERFSTPSVRLLSKVGAGDSMVGGLLAGLAQERSLSDATRLGVAAGTAAVMRSGTELCRREDVERLYKGVRRQE